VGLKSPLKRSKNVLFPEPLSPVIAIISPLEINIETSFNISSEFSLYAKLTSSNFISLSKRIFAWGNITDNLLSLFSLS
jgi:hypothetical protein